MENSKILEFAIDGKTYQSQEQYRTGEDLKKMAGISAGTDLFLSIAHPWEDELIEGTAKVNLARPGIEYFYVKKKLPFKINGEPFIWYKQYITGREIRELGKIAEDVELFLDIREPFEDEAIGDDSLVDLARPGKERFISREKQVEVIIVNGKPKPWTMKSITFEELVVLAFGSTAEDGVRAYTVTFSKGPKPRPEGTIVRGDTVIVKNKTIFNVTATDKS